MFPAHIAAVLDQYGIPAATKTALYDAYCSFGPAILEVFADWVAASGADPRESEPEDVAILRTELVDRYVRLNHPRWIEGMPTPTLYHPRVAAGRASGLAAPFGRFDEEAEGTAAAAARVTRAIVGPDQPLPRGVLVVSRDGHFGGRSATISFDVVAESLDDARALAHAEGRQHTLPGSAGETSGTIEGELALLWEIQPNVLKPHAGRNREAVPVYRRHRNWHVATLAAAILWLRERAFTVWILRGGSIATTHEVNPAQPVSPEIAEHHDRTVRRVVEALGLGLADPSNEDTQRLLATESMNAALR